jgi:predicted permease
MSWIQRLCSSFRTKKYDKDLDSELAFHLEMRKKERVSQGATDEEARGQALERFGNLTRTKEACREQSTLMWLGAAGQDVRYAVRNMRRNLGFSLAATACLAMGIGANTTVFSFVNTFFFQSLPSNIVLVQRASGSPVSFPEYQDWQRFNHVFDEVFAFTPGERLAIGRDETEHILGETIAGNYFQALGVAPAAGRLLAQGDEYRPLAVLGHRYWTERLLRDPAIVGGTIWIDRTAFTVVGIAPPSFHGMITPWSTDAWVTPYLHRERQQDRRLGWVLVAAHLKPATTQAQADAAMKSLDSELARQYPDRSRADSQPKRDPLVVARRSGLSGSPVWSVFLAMAALLMAVAGIIFLIACANVAGLLMARALVRHREILIRLSIGATRSRIIRQLLTESLLLGLMGATAGVIMALVAGDALAGLLPKSVSGGFRFQHGIDGNVLAFTLLLATAGVLFSGLAPAVRAARFDLVSAGKNHTVSLRTPRLREFLVAAQVAGSVLVLATAGVFVRSFQAAQKADPGFNTAHLLTVDLNLRPLKGPQIPAREALSQLRNRVGELPGVVSASLANVLPLGNTRVLSIEGNGETATARVDSGYFRTMGIPLMNGREPHPGDRNTVIVNETLANRLWPGQDPVGQFIRVDGPHPRQEVIGVTATGRYWSLSEPSRAFLYQFSEEFDESHVSLVVRTRNETRNLGAAVAEEIRRLGLPSSPVQTAEQLLDRWFEPQRSAALLLSILGVTALGLAVTGLYALLAQLVIQRTAEIAVRVTLGASRAGIAWMLLRHSARLVLTGTAVGVSAAVAVAHVLAGLAGQVNPLDGITMLGVAALIATVAAAATLAPAYKAMRIDPMSALRAE